MPESRRLTGTFFELGNAIILRRHLRPLSSRNNHYHLSTDPSEQDYTSSKTLMLGP